MGSKSQKSTLYYLLGAFALVFAFCAFFIYLPQIRSALGLSASVDPATLRGYRARLKRLYSKYNPSKLDDIDSTLEKWRGREKALFKALHKKYVKPNKKVKDGERQRKREERRKRKLGIDPDDEIPEGETEEEAAKRRRRRKERDRERRKEERRQERGGREYYDEDEEEDRKGKYGDYFDGGGDYEGDDDYARYEGTIELVDDDDDE